MTRKAVRTISEDGAPYLTFPDLLFLLNICHVYMFQIKLS